ncbi:LysM peptidoglycan-binding domain-containing protein [Microbacterium sp.]|uniref:LysM peptidoglycan-binding domain-containing protein n=1 Tax=Microbacterium sp. TaxID=51671 RepID=UPI002811F772|nr:LysM peptidoglycan-binding domain-containing protein [Microbacterium sp.]
MSTTGIQAPVTIDITATLAARRASAATTRLRLTTRGRRVLLGLAATPLVAGIVASVLAGGSALASGEQAEPVVFETVTVLPGDTLWSIAAEAAPGVDPREVVEDIIRLNNLPSGMVQAGSEIAIPVEYAD